MVDAERIGERLGGLEHLLERLEAVRAAGRGRYLRDEQRRRPAAAARQRNLLVHLYLDVDDDAVFAALGNLDDLREFAAHAQRLADAGRGDPRP